MNLIGIIKSAFGVGRDVYEVQNPLALVDSTSSFSGDQALKSVTFDQTMIPSQINQPVWSSWSAEKAIKGGMHSSSWVYVCISAIAEAMASIPMVAEVQKGGVWEREPTHPLQLLMEKPNSHETQTTFKETLTTHLFLAGNTLAAKIRGGSFSSTPEELIIVPPDQIKPVPGKTEYVSHYEHSVSGKKRKVDTRDVIHIKFTDPGNPLWGLAPLKPGSKLVDIDVKAKEWNMVSFQNRAVSDGAWVNDSHIGDDQWNQARNRIRITNSGAGNARNPMVMGGGWRYVKMQMSPAEMDFIDSLKLNREEICAIFRVPPPVVGILEKATYSNFNTAHLVFWRDTIKPLALRIAEALTFHLAEDFGGDVRLVPDFSVIEVLRTVPAATMAQVKELFAMGVPMSVLDEKYNLNLGDYPGKSISYVGSIPTGHLGDGDPMDTPDEDDIKSYVEEQQEKRTAAVISLKSRLKELKTVA